MKAFDIDNPLLLLLVIDSNLKRQEESNNSLINNICFTIFDVFALKCRTAALTKLRFCLPVLKGKQFRIYDFCTRVATRFLSRHVSQALCRARVAVP